MKLNSALQDQMADALYDTFNGGLLKIFGDHLIVSINLPNPAFSPASGGTKRIQGVWKGEATISGTANRCKFESFDKSKVLEGTVTDKSGDGDVKLDNVKISSGQTVTVTNGEGLIS